MNLLLFLFYQICLCYNVHSAMLVQRGRTGYGLVFCGVVDFSLVGWLISAFSEMIAMTVVAVIHIYLIISVIVRQKRR